MKVSIRRMTAADIPAVVGLQAEAFPPPFDPQLWWEADHIEAHLAKFPAGQFVADMAGRVVGSCSNTLISDAKWAGHLSWYETVGGPLLEGFDPAGTTLYGLDISVHPEVRRMGVGRGLYEARFGLVRTLGLARYGTACRMPDFAPYHLQHPGVSVAEFAQRVVAGQAQDRTLTPLLRYGVVFRGVIEGYMDDEESGNAAALLEWTP